MMGRYEGLLIDSCPQEKRLTKETDGLSTLPGCPRLWPCFIPPCTSQTFPQHKVTCLVTSCSVTNPFPITQVYFLLYPVSFKPFHLGPGLFLVIFKQHNVTLHTDRSFSLSNILLHTCSYPNFLYLCSGECVYISQTVQPDALFRCYVKATTAAALTHQWAFLQ